MVNPDRFVLVLLLLLFLPGIDAREERRDPETGRIRVLYCGDTARASYAMLVDPVIQPTFVPSACLTEGEQLNRFLRLYLSRTYNQFISDYDLINLGDQQVDHFPAKYLMWFSDSVTDEGLGLSMTGGIGGFGGDAPRGIGSWEHTPVGDVLPVENMDTTSFWNSYRLVITDPEHETIKPLPWDTAPPLHGLSIVQLKQGAKDLTRSNLPDAHPVMICWDVGRGRTYGFTSCLGGGWGYDFIKWDYYLDFVDGYVYYTAGIPVPQDLSLVHSIRGNLLQFRVSRTMMYTLFDFVDKIGGNTARLEKDLASIDGVISGAEKAYIEQDYESALTGTRDALADLGRLDRDAMELKDRTMLWTYMIEWLSVGGVSGIVGWIVYEVMIRRRLYRDVGTTRFGEPRWKGD